MNRESPVRGLRTLLLPLLVLATACAINPATGERQLSFVSESQEIQMGQESHPQIVAAYGAYDAPELASLVSRLGHEMAAASERPELPWEFTLLDDASVNAFALPGGFIYVTRGILAHFNSEAELAGVLGHEIGHVTARHSVNQMSRQQLMQIGLIGGMIFSETARDWGGVLQGIAGLATLKFSRDDELESDRLGVRYMTRTGYDARESAAVFRTLGRISAQSGSRLPEWQSTHPDPENREEKINQMVAESGVSYADARVGRDSYLRMLDGIVFGLDPRQGYFAGSLFRHPEMEFRIRFPDGWQRRNETSRVIAGNEAGNAFLELTLADASSVGAAIDDFAGQQGLTVRSDRSVSVNGISARLLEFSARGEQVTFRGAAQFLEHEGLIFRIMGLSTEEGWSANRSATGNTLGSFERETDPEVLNARAWRLEIVELPSAMTTEDFLARWPSIASEETVLTLNRVSPGETLRAGRLMKRVVGERLPGTDR